MYRTLILLTLVTSVSAADILDCGDPFANGVGPWDYRDPEARKNPHKIPIVEKHHFTSKVERLVGGEANVVDLGGDIDYVLRAVPNHHRALYAISRYELERGRLSRKWRTVECYFERAMRFRPDDAVVRMIFGIHLAMRGKHDAAIKAYEQVTMAMPRAPELYYNLGLALLEVGKPREASEAARVAYEGGYPLQGLDRKLKKLGFDWRTAEEYRAVDPGLASD